MRVHITKRKDGPNGEIGSETVADFSVDFSNELHSLCFYETFLKESERTHAFPGLKAHTVLIGYDVITIICEEKNAKQ